MANETTKAEIKPVETVTVKVDGSTVEVPKTTPDWQGNPIPTTILQACKMVGKEIPHYCYHPRIRKPNDISVMGPKNLISYRRSYSLEMRQRLLFVENSIAKVMPILDKK